MGRKAEEADWKEKFGGRDGFILERDLFGDLFLCLSCVPSGRNFVVLFLAWLETYTHWRHIAMMVPASCKYNLVSLLNFLGFGFVREE